jgi:hydroxyethylthiazole kinase-like uncharacterized protein yjeF
MAVEHLKEKDIKGLVERNVNFSKGDAGRVLIIGGSEQYVGSAVLAGLAALRAGVDSVVIAAPEASARLMNAFSPDLVTVKLPGADLGDEHLKRLEELSGTATVVLIGPGLGVSKQREEWLAKLLPLLRVPLLVLDADATKQVKLAGLEKTIIFANRREYEHLKEFNGLSDERVAPSLGTNILVVKAREDRIITADGACTVGGGHARATVAGTGDVLSGLAAALYAQTKEPLKSAYAACVIAKKCAEMLGEQQQFCFHASDVATTIPSVMKDLRVFRVTKYEPQPKRPEPLPAAKKEGGGIRRRLFRRKP